MDEDWHSDLDDPARGICPGDSGAPPFGTDADGLLKLVGVSWSYTGSTHSYVKSSYVAAD